MKQNSFALVVSLVLTGIVSSAFAYEDDYLSITGDESVRTNWVGERVVYVFTNAASAASVTFKQTMTLQEALIVGGGGAGGSWKGGGGGGGGVVDLSSPTYCAAGSMAEVIVGAGGIGNSEWSHAQPDGKGAGYGSPSSLTVGSATTVAYGGGGGGAAGSAAGTADAVPSKMTTSISLGCGGGAGTKKTGIQTAEYYTADQGCYGGEGAVVGGSGGGGGAGTPGQNGTISNSGNGGEGVTSWITGGPEVYGSGGGGGGAVTFSSGACDPGIGGTHGGAGLKGKTPAKAGSGDDGFGAGGGGGGYDGSASAGGNGGSGTVILSFTVGGQVSKPEFDADDIHVEYRDNETQPAVSVLLGGEAGYSATVSVLVGLGDDFTSTNVFNAVKSGDEPGAFAFIYPSPGETFTVKVIASADGVDDTVVTKEVTVPTDQGLVVPAHVGKGGGADVIHVRVGAHGRNNGSCWTDAFDDLRAGIAALLASGKHELWFSGDEEVSVSAEVIAPTEAIALRGGFAGTENVPSARVLGAKSELDGGDVHVCLSFDAAANVVVDGFAFIRGNARGLAKTGRGDITVTNCLFDANGLAAASVAGRAMSISDAAGEARAEVVDCCIRNHREKAGSTSGNAGAVYLEGLASARLSDCTFTGNGLAAGTFAYWDLDGRQGTWGVALAVKETPVLVERCAFRANVAPSVKIDNNYSGGTVALRGDCGGSVFRNCAWVGNENLFAKRLADDYENRDAGALVVDLADAEEPVTVENCTFAGNLYEGPESTAGLNVRAGTVNVLNSIFAGNLCGTAKKRFCPADVRVSEGATVNASYTLFGGETNRLADAGGTLNVGAGCMDADPLFVTPTNFYLTCIAEWSGGIYYTEASTSALLDADIHVTKKSPAIDAGDPRSDYSREPSPNGRRVNLGVYGNTAEAALSKFGLIILVQ